MKPELAKDYEGLRRQFNSLWTLYKNTEKNQSFLLDKVKKLEQEISNLQSLESEKKANEELTNQIEVLEREIQSLKAL